MKTREFIEWMDKLGYDLETHDDFYYIVEKKPRKYLAAVVSKEVEGIINTYTSIMETMDEDEKIQFLNIIIEYSTTPVECRKEIKYYFKIDNGRGEYMYVNYHKGYYHFNVKEEIKGYQTKFTELEYNKFPTALKSLYSYGYLIKVEVSKDVDETPEVKVNSIKNTQELEERIEELEDDIDGLESELYDKEELIADLENQVYDLERELGLN